jgi:hypothetical protein
LWTLTFPTFPILIKNSGFCCVSSCCRKHCEHWFVR